MPAFKVKTSRTVIRVLEEPEMHEKGISKMSTSNSKIIVTLLFGF